MPLSLYDRQKFRANGFLHAIGAREKKPELSGLEKWVGDWLGDVLSFVSKLLPIPGASFVGDVVDSAAGKAIKIELDKVNSYVTDVVEQNFIDRDGDVRAHVLVWGYRYTFNILGTKAGTKTAAEWIANFENRNIGKYQLNFIYFLKSLQLRLARIYQARNAGLGEQAAMEMVADLPEGQGGIGSTGDLKYSIKRVIRWHNVKDQQSFAENAVHVHNYILKDLTTADIDRDKNGDPIIKTGNGALFQKAALPIAAALAFFLMRK